MLRPRISRILESADSTTKILLENLSFPTNPRPKGPRDPRRVFDVRSPDDPMTRSPDPCDQTQRETNPWPVSRFQAQTLLLTQLRCVALALCLGSFDGLAQSLAGADVYFDLLRFRLGPLCQFDLQYSIVVIGGDALRIEGVRQRE